MFNPVTEVSHVFKTFWSEYQRKTASKLQLVDSFTALCLTTAVILHVYMLALGSYPFNSYLAGLFCCIGCAVFSVCLRMQLDPANSKEFPSRAPERAYADFILANLTLFFIVWNYIG